MQDVLIREVDPQEPLFQSLLKGREEVLRRPLGLQLTSHDREGERQHRHYCLLWNDQMVAGVMAEPKGSYRWQIRQMWVLSEHRSKGLGARLLSEVEERLRMEGARAFYMEARESAVPFYENLGFQISGHSFEKLEILHFPMEKA